ncbi:MAG: BTAD domain-containing putative transcriptional regulator [Propionibacteriaceae bacterium]
MERRTDDLVDRATALVAGVDPPPGSEGALADVASPVVRLLGPVQAVVDGAPVLLTSPKLRRLFTLLALTPNRVVSTSRLIDQLWGEDTPESATAALHVYVSRLRQALSGAADPASLRVSRRAPGYVLSVVDEAVDVRRFTRLVEAAGHQIQVDPRRALDLLDEALALVSGEPLADVVDEIDPLAADAQRLREMVIAAQEQRIEAMLGCGLAEAAALQTGALLGDHPFRESLQALHVLALYRCGRAAEALTVYEEFRQRLADDLGADPGPQLRRLHTRILQQDPDLDGPAPVRPDVSAPTPGAVAEAVAVAGSEAPNRAGPLSDPIVGREPVLVRLEQALAQLVEGRGGVWTLSGEAGIGKTRLVEELSRFALDRHLTVVWGRGEEGADDAPYRPWKQVLRALPDVAGTAPARVLLGEGAVDGGSRDATARLELHDRTTELLSSRDQPLVLILEDVQWFDQLSRELLLTAARQVPTAPVLMALTLRRDARTPAPLVQLAAQLARLPASHQVRVSGLSEDEAIELVAARAGLTSGPRPAWLGSAVARGDGNPFFLTELTRLIQDQGPETGSARAGLPIGIRDVLLDRLSPLSADARALLDLASVIGRQVPYSLLERVLELPPQRLDTALAEVVDAALVTEELLPELSVRFSHALVQELLIDELRPSVRTRLHARVGMVLAGMPGRVDSDHVLAHLTAGAAAVPVTALLSALLDAARSASGQTAFEHAQKLLHRALDLVSLMPEGAERDTVELRIQARLGSAIAGQQGWSAPAAEAALSRAYALARRAEPDAETFGAIYHQVAWLVAAAEFPRASNLGEELLARSLRAPTGQARIYELLGRVARGLVAWYQGRDLEAVSELSRAYELATTGVDADLVEVFTADPAIPILSLLANALVHVGRVDEGLSASREALVLARQTRPPETATAITAAMMLAADRDERERTRELATELLLLARTHGLAMYVIMATVPLAWADTLLATDPGARELALSQVRQGHDLFSRSGARQFASIMAVLRAEAELRAGHPLEARQAAAEGVRAAQQHGIKLWWDRLSALASG